MIVKLEFLRVLLFRYLVNFIIYLFLEATFTMSLDDEVDDTFQRSSNDSGQRLRYFEGTLWKYRARKTLLWVVTYVNVWRLITGCKIASKPRNFSSTKFQPYFMRNIKRDISEIFITREVLFQTFSKLIRLTITSNVYNAFIW